MKRKTIILAVVAAAAMAYAIVNIKTGEVLVDRVHDRTYAIDDVDDYNKFLPYARKQVQAVVARIPPHSYGGGIATPC